MKYVNLYFTENSLNKTLLFKFILKENNTIEVKKMKKDIEIKDYLGSGKYIIGKGGKKYSIESDGINFLKNLKYAFSGSRLRASNLMDE